VEIGVGLDARLNLPVEETARLTREAAELGYTSAWTPASATGLDSFHVCARWQQTSGLSTGISIVPVPTWTPVSLAVQAATVAVLTGGTFILGVGPGQVHESGYRQQFGLPEQGPVGVMRDYMVALRGLLSGEKVTREARLFALRGVQLAVRPPRAPVYLAALGPQMLRLAGELADGVLPNWASAEQIGWLRERVAEGARKAGRDPASVPVVQYIRVCVDEDEGAARRAFGQQVLAYAMARPGASKEHGYRAHFARMGFGPTLDELEARRDRGATEEELIDATPDELLRKVGYYGRPDRAARAFRRLAEGLDTAIVRVIVARPGPEAVRVAMRALRPELVLRSED
jgi:alkanesulfonate monooxygenase SsuD/methylene tetrahydromethanopterin reductase-like flavin-dependent oxidoreductase (luciferase family)